MGLTFGYNQGLPKSVKAAWGARLIVQQDGYTDFLGNRQDSFGEDADVDKLFAWINTGAMTTARKKAEELLASYKMSTRRAEHFVLYEDDKGAIVGNTNGSAGYLYVAAWLKADVLAPA
jgi:hypothetical protein